MSFARTVSIALTVFAILSGALARAEPTDRALAPTVRFFAFNRTTLELKFFRRTLSTILAPIF